MLLYKSLIKIAIINKQRIRFCKIMKYVSQNLYDKGKKEEKRKRKKDAKLLINNLLHSSFLHFPHLSIICLVDNVNKMK